MGRPLGKKFNGKVSINVTTFDRATFEYYADMWDVTMQEAIIRIGRERVEADGNQDDVAVRALVMVQDDAPTEALRALEMVQADAPAPEYAAPEVFTPTYPDTNRDVEILIDGKWRTGFWGNVSGCWAIYPDDDSPDLLWDDGPGLTVTAWRELAPAPLVEAVDAPSAELQGD